MGRGASPRGMKEWWHSLLPWSPQSMLGDLSAFYLVFVIHFLDN